MRGVALNEHVGFLAGWAMILDYFLIPLGSIIYAALTAHRLLPSISYSKSGQSLSPWRSRSSIFRVFASPRAPAK